MATSAERDALANNPDFQLKVRFANLKTSHAVIAGATPNSNLTVIKYGQLWLAQPQGSQVTAMSYGVLAADDTIDEDTSEEVIQGVVGNIFIQQAYAWYQIPPPQTEPTA